MATNIANKILSYLRSGRTGRISPNTTIESYYGGYLVRLHGNAIMQSWWHGGTIRKTTER